MSINVTVTGNPVSIKKGRMVTAAASSCGDSNRNDFNKRRIIRLEQVRQQSKDIAENVRNKVRQEKRNRLGELEKQGEVVLKNWQAKKLLELHSQYQDALDGIGLGHQQADCVGKEEMISSQQRKLDDRVAQDRGREAAERLQIEKNESNLKSAVPIQHKKLSRDVENSRSAFVSSLRKSTGKSPSKKAKKDEKTVNVVPKLMEIPSDSEFSDSEDLRPSLASPKTTKGPVNKVSKEAQTSLRVETTEKAAQTQPESISITPCVTQCTGILSDNRISERIKRRPLLNPDRPFEPVSEHEIAPSKITVPCNCCQCPERPQQEHRVDAGVQKDTIRTGETPNLIKENPVNDETRKKVLKSKSPSSPIKSASPVKMKMKKQPQEIPTKPRVTLKATRPTPTPQVPPLVGVSSTTASKVQYYDHPNRFTKYGPSTSRVGRIDEENLTISPHLLTEADLKEEMRKRDLEAHNRGLQAMEREKISREYKDLLKKLPVLQKQERICDINGDKPQYHMPDERLEAYERKRQNEMDNGYEKLFAQRKPATVTLPKVVDDSWDVDVRDVPPPTRRRHDNRSRQLNELLDSLRSQKENLLKEIEGLPDSASVATLLEDLTSTTLPKSKKDKKRKRDKEEGPPSPLLDSDSIDLIDSGSKSRLPKDSGPGHHPSPRKKPKIKVLQNMSTQTTPKLQSLESTTTKTCGSCIKGSEPCFCDQPSELCEILIKIKEGDQPEVTVNPPVLGKNVKVVTETQKSSGNGESKGGSRSQPKEDVVPPPRKVVRKAPTSVKDRASWREHLSHASSLSTGSTSYYSPPEYFKSLNSTDSTTQVPRMPIGKPNRPNVSDFSRSASSHDSGKIDPRLLTYIKKLLNMSRASIDDLTVTSTSGVSTPSQSVIEMPTNNPLALEQLKNVMKYFNLNPSEVGKQLNSETSDSTPHYNTSESEKPEHSFDLKTKEQLAQYSDLAESCNRKISSLTAMIEKVREEKAKMLHSPPGSNGNDSTAYLEAPPSKLQTKAPDAASTPLVSLDELDSDLLSVDLDYAEKLKNFTPQQLQEEQKRQEESLGASDEELLKRLKGLLGDDQSKIDEHVPMLNIPKLPKLKCPPCVDDTNGKKRPPPVKNVRVVQRLNGNYSIPHELSTIVEADSQLSTKVDSTPKSSESQKRSTPKVSNDGSVPDLLSEVGGEVESSPTGNSTDDKSDLEAMESMLYSIGMEWAIPTLRKTREALALSSSSSEAGKSGEMSLSLREFLGRSLIASSSLKSDGRPPNAVGGDIHDISIIQRRTSTPVLGQPAAAEMRKRVVGFSAESDLSSVKESKSASGSDKELKFYDLNDEYSQKSA